MFAVLCICVHTLISLVNVVMASQIEKCCCVIAGTDNSCAGLDSVLLRLSRTQGGRIILIYQDAGVSVTSTTQFRVSAMLLLAIEGNLKERRRLFCENQPTSRKDSVWEQKR
jgi:hypothetical protein